MHRWRAGFVEASSVRQIQTLFSSHDHGLTRNVVPNILCMGEREDVFTTSHQHQSKGRKMGEINKNRECRTLNSGKHRWSSIGAKSEKVEGNRIETVKTENPMNNTLLRTTLLTWDNKRTTSSIAHLLNLREEQPAHSVPVNRHDWPKTLLLRRCLSRRTRWWSSWPCD